MTNKELLKIIDKNIAPKTDREKTFFASKDKKNNVSSADEKTGNNQYRELANICLNAECFEEIELLIMYKEAKTVNGISWSKSYKNKNLAKIILECMKIIKDKSTDENNNYNDEVCRNNLSLFFGYLYWSARVWSADGAAILKEEAKG